uniref:lysozyme n=1 Tax=Nyssomyia neivai TaxID=330878 RepID=A0A1L8E3D0_9DIPT
MSRWILSGILVAVAITLGYADVSHVVAGNQNAISDICLGCICEAMSGCNRAAACDGNICGLFKITHPYWVDAGKPTQSGDAPEATNAFSNCVTEPFCAGRAVQNYMGKFGQDCNNDGKVDCSDFLAIHILGGYGCSGEIPAKFTNSLSQCLYQASAFQNSFAGK